MSDSTNLVQRLRKPKLELWTIGLQGTMRALVDDGLTILDEAASAIEALQSEVDELRSERKWMGKVIDERDDKIRQLRLIANVNGDWNIKYGEAINRATTAEAERDTLYRFARLNGIMAIDIQNALDAARRGAKP